MAVVNFKIKEKREKNRVLKGCFFDHIFERILRGFGEGLGKLLEEVWEGFGSRDQVGCYSSAASRKTKSRGPTVREAPRRRLGKRTAAGRGASLDLRPLEVFLQAALAADLIAASISLHVPMSARPFLDPAV